MDILWLEDRAIGPKKLEELERMQYYSIHGPMVTTMSTWEPIFWDLSRILLSTYQSSSLAANWLFCYSIAKDGFSPFNCLQILKNETTRTSPSSHMLWSAKSLWWPFLSYSSAHPQACGFSIGSTGSHEGHFAPSFPGKVNSEEAFRRLRWS